MKQTRRHFLRLATALPWLGLGGMLGSCGSSAQPPVRYSASRLVSDGAALPAAHTDALLKNPWGIAFNPNGFVWVADNGTSVSTLYDGNGVPQSLVVAIPSGAAGAAAPTGIVFNPGSEFFVSQNGVAGKSAFLFVGEGGTIAGWSPAVNPTNAVTAVDTGIDGALYKGVALASFGGASFLYAADFRHRRIDVYDGSFRRAALPGAFIEPSLPADYTPFNIAAAGGALYVAYAQFTPPAEDENRGAGLGIVSVFDSGGRFIRRLITGGRLNAPWGMALSPPDFSGLPSVLLVGNFGDGMINAYAPDSGDWLATLAREPGQPLLLDGLWGIAFGNGLNNQPANTLFFAAGPNDEQNGIYGRIDPL